MIVKLKTKLLKALERKVVEKKRVDNRKSFARERDLDWLF